MAMDKEQLLRYFSAHYLSRREVLYKLPLNVSIGSFWPELLNRRKANATILPLHDGQGKPYWFVLTDKMVAASERLCKEAMKQETEADPYKAAATPAMTEEIFFTSFVEGAQIPLQEAMDFLNRGTEPENIGEQMIFNNSKAVSAVMRSLYRPIDEQYTKTLAYMLTEDMDNCAEDYRQTDVHPIAAMNSEPYEVPPASVIPERMNDFYAFLQSPDVHPLIKAAAGQAFLLATRPFPEGNERLSRMISLAILLRSGYDFFRDISISAMIARENYRYYKSMCETIRAENGNDLTYFMEYYLTMLVQTLDMKNERERKREQDSVQRERDMAKKPLVKPVESVQNQSTEIIVQPCAKQAEKGEETESVMTHDTQADREQPDPSPKESPPDPEARFQMLESSRYKSVRDIAERIQESVSNGKRTFTSREWAAEHELSLGRAGSELALMYKHGIAKRTGSLQKYVYEIIVNLPNGAYESPADVSPECNEVRDTLERMRKDRLSERDIRVSDFLLDRMANNESVFRNMDWVAASAFSKSCINSDLIYAQGLGLIEKIDEGKGNVRYRIRDRISIGPNLNNMSKQQTDIFNRVYAAFGTGTFTIADCCSVFGLSRKCISNHINSLVIRNAVSRCNPHSALPVYRLAVTPDCLPQASPMLSDPFDTIPATTEESACAV